MLPVCMTIPVQDRGKIIHKYLVSLYFMIWGGSVISS